MRPSCSKPTAREQTSKATKKCAKTVSYKKMINTFIIAALTADGFIAKDPKEPSTAWTSKADKKHFMEVSKSAGAIIMGLNTFLTIGKALPGRRNIVYSPEPVNHPDIEVTALPPKELIEKLEKEGITKVAICGGATIYNMFIKSGVVNTIHFTIEPVLFGSGLNIFKESFFKKLALVNVERKDDSIFAEYRVLN